MKKRILSFALALCFVFTLIPTAFADSAPTSGECGDNLTWTLDSNGTLTISGTGAMYGYFRGEAPWSSKADSIVKVVIPNSVTHIGDYAFSGCSSLTSVTIPKSVTGIGWYAFSGCSSLTSVTIPDSVTDIGEGAFEDCGNLTSITVDKGNEYYCSDNGVLFSKDYKGYYEDGKGFSGGITELHTYPAGKSTASYIIPDSVASLSVTSIMSDAFSGCSSLTSVTIPDSVTSIGVGAFEGCGKLTSITVDKGNEYYCSDNGVLFSKDYELYYEDGKYVDKGIMELHTYPAGKSAASYIIPGRVAGLSVTSIEWGAFFGCSSLTSVTIPDSVTYIGVMAFFECHNIENVYYNGDIEFWLGIDFEDSVHSNPCSNGSRLYFNGELVTDVAIPDSVTSIGEGAFSGCSSLTSVMIPDSVTSIGEDAFCDCSSLTSVTIGNSVESIGDSAFWECTNLTSITIPASVTSIGDAVFCWCDSLTDVYYGGNAAQWKAISIGDDNYPLFDATIHYAGEPAAPAAPVIKITTSAGKPKISWSKVDGAAKYKVFYSTDGKKYYQLIETTKTSVTHTKAKIGTKYYYKVKAVNASGAESEFSNDVSIKCRPAAPTVTISRSGGKAKLSWKAVSGATKYWVYRSTDGKKYTRVAITTKLSYADSKSKSGTKYYYKVMAVAVVNETNVGSACSAVKSIMTTLAKPTVKITTSNGKPKLTWGKVTGADKYYVYRSTNGKDYTLLVKTTKTSVTNTGAKKGTKYYYKVKAICSANTKANSVFSTVVSIKATK